MTDNVQDLKADLRLKADTLSKSKAYFMLKRLRHWAKLVGYRIYRLTGEVIAITLGVGLIWFATINILLARQTANITFLQKNAALWFAEAFDGSDASISRMDVDWEGANNALVFRAKDIVVTDETGKEVQRINRFSTGIGIESALKGKLSAKNLFIDGGAVTYLKSDDGKVVAGLGTPETVGKLGPVWRGQTARSEARAFSMGGLETLKAANATAYVSDRQDGLELQLKKTFLDVENKGKFFEISGSTEVTSNDEMAPISAKLTVSPDYQDFDLAVRVENLNLKTISPKTGRLAGLKALDAPMTLESRITSTRETGLETVDVSMTAENGRLEFGPVSQNFDNASAKANYDKVNQALRFTDVKLKSDRVQLDGTASFADMGTPVDGFFTRPGDFRINFNTLDIDATPFFPEPMNFEKAVLSGIWDRKQRHLRFSEIDLDFGDFATDLTGMTKRNEDGKWSHIRLDGRIEGVMTPQDLLSVWPTDFALGARNYIARAITSAEITDLDLTLDMPEAALRSGRLTNDQLSLDFNVSNAEVRYISTMTPFTNASGRGQFQGNRFGITVNQGNVGGVILDSGKVDIPRLWPKGGDFTVDVKGHGPLKDIVTLIDQKPFQYLQRYGVSAEKFDGQGQVELSITRPLLEFFDQNRIRYTASGTFSDVTAPFSFGEHQVTKGEVDLAVDRNGLKVTGPINIGPWRTELEWSEIFDDGATPTRFLLNGVLGRDDLDAFGVGLRQYFDGDVKVSVNARARGLAITSADIKADLTEADLQIAPYWSKAKGMPGNFAGTLTRKTDGAVFMKGMIITAPGLSVAGDIDLAENFRLINLDLKKAEIENFIDASIKAKPDERNEKFDFFVTGDFLDVSPFITTSLQTRESTFDAPILLTASLNQLQLSPNYNLQEANILYAHDGVGVRQMRLKGQIADGDFTAEMVADDSANKRDIRVDIPNASEAAFAFLKLDNIKGGRLEIDASLPPTGQEGALRGQANIENFTLVKAPILAQMLSLASLQGLGNVLGGEGLKFDSLNVPFSMQDGVLSVRDAKASGSAIGITGEGDIKFDDGLLDFDGVLVPAYTANSMLGSVPVIGGIFVGKKGEGIFALSYTVKGTFSQTQIAVNPLSALTPGFLRNIFKPSRKDLPEEVKKTIVEIAPKPDE